MGGWQDLSYQVNEVMSPKDPLTALVVNLTGVDPDDAFSTVPYEKGSAFLWYLEDTGEIKKNLRILLCILQGTKGMMTLFHMGWW